jgi:hypothetical protein
VLEPDERERHDAAEALYNSLTEAIRAKEIEDGDSDRFERNISRSRDFAPNVNLNREAIRGGRSLDELLWATDESVPPARSTRPARSASTRPPATPSSRSSSARQSMTSRPSSPADHEFLPENRQVVRSFQKTVADMSSSA